MKALNLHDIRKKFLEFFEEKNHFVEKSFSLIPKNDKSLLLINAGMAPLKPYFLGTEEPPNKRMTTCQKCIRTGDIDNVGKTDRHGTFFEMLGNFSFGDYFKTEAIKWSWEFMTEKLNVPIEKLWVSVFYEDDEAYNIWKDIVKISEDKIVKLGREDNFWEHGLGPCGPCSEIYIDRGEKFGCGSKDCKPGCECDRFVEVWNLVFSQFDKDEKGNYNLLPNPNIDTGMGLERITVVLNEANNIFEIEPINSIIKGIENISKIKYKDNNKDDVSIRVMTDHLRAMTFMIADGIIPSNEGRGYVLRRLIRRAYRHGKLLGIEGEFLFKLSNIVVENWDQVYEGLKDKKNQIEKIIKIEEQKFQETIDQGNNILEEYLKELKENSLKILDGKKAFKLYDTYGFPLDLTKEILFEKGYEVSEKDFNKEMEEQRERARKARLDGNIDGWQVNNDDINIDYKTEFKGYDEVVLYTEVIHLIKKGEFVNNLNEGEEGILVLKETPFYGESGGQIGDIGFLKGNELDAIIANTSKGKNGTTLHNIKILKGKLKIQDKVNVSINVDRRKDIARNHTATHLLHSALKNVIGEHVNQSGSLVTDTRLRFDFTHFEGLTNDQIKDVEKLVNLKIFDSLNVKVVNRTLDEARKLGATALFDEKYGKTVRVVSAGDYSTELCGGTHVENTSQIQIFKIINEAGIASGIRRIEAVTGTQALNYINEMYDKFEETSFLLKTNKNDINDKINNILDENKKLEKELEALKAKFANSKIDDIICEVFTVKGINVLAKKIDGLDMNGLRQMGDNLKDKLGSIVIVLATINDDKVNFIATATNDLIKKGIHSGNLIREIAKFTGGSGGGRPDMAQAGGKDVTKVDDALELVEVIVLKQLS